MYNIGQFRRPQLDSYSTPLSMDLDRQQTSGASSGDILFYNACIKKMKKMPNGLPLLYINKKWRVD